MGGQKLKYHRVEGGQSFRFCGFAVPDFEHEEPSIGRGES